jgi:hypothetical protein
MKSNGINKIRRIGTAIAFTFVLGFVGSTQAQYKAAGDDGIAASPKVRQAIDLQNKTHLHAVVPASTAAMACSKCEDKVTTRVEATVHGPNRALVQVSTHQCETCGTDLKTTGTGKMKQTVATHTCGSCATVAN